jgi:hypothetical protein
MLHALFNGTKLLGLFSDHEKCQLMMTGLINNGFVTKEKMSIRSFFENTIAEGEYDNQEFSESMSEYEIDSEPFTTASDRHHEPKVKNNKEKPVIVELSPESKKKRDEEIKEKVDIQNSIFELKRQKEKLEESKRVYNVDIELYNKFKKIKVYQMKKTLWMRLYQWAASLTERVS